MSTGRMMLIPFQCMLNAKQCDFGSIFWHESFQLRMRDNRLIFIFQYRQSDEGRNTNIKIVLGRRQSFLARSFTVSRDDYIIQSKVEE